MIELFLCPKNARSSLIAHLDKVLHRQLGKCLGIVFAPSVVVGKGTLTITGIRGQAFIKHDTVFEGGVHALPVEWDNGMSCIADKCDFILIEPRGASNSN